MDTNTALRPRCYLRIEDTRFAVDRRGHDEGDRYGDIIQQASTHSENACFLEAAVRRFEPLESSILISSSPPFQNTRQCLPRVF